MSDLILDAMRQAVRAELEPMLKDLAPAPKPALMTTAELARELRVCSKSIDRLRSKGMPAVYVGDSCPRFRLDAVLSWLESRPSVA